MLLQRKVVVSQSCGGSARRGVMVVMRIAQKRVEYRGEGIFLMLLWKKRYYQSRSRRVNSPQEHRNALRSSYRLKYNRLRC